MALLTNKKEAWKKKLTDFPNAEKIVNELDAGRHVARLFDEGSFSLSVLWACNVMEEIINATADGIIQTDPTKNRHSELLAAILSVHPDNLKI
jgi:hypothetical protein